jgi:dATP pyrophosphohydrolase
MPAARRPESVLVVVYTRALECLLLERLEPAGFWQSVTGALEWGEEPREAALRELREETGLLGSGLRDTGVRNSFPILPAWRPRYAPDVTANVEHVWRLTLERPETVVLNPTEHRRFAWLPLEEAISRVGSWTNREALERLRDGHT